MVSGEWLKRHIRDFDFILVLTLIGISIISSLAVYSATAQRPGLHNIFQKELLWQVLGYTIMILFVLVDYRIFTNNRLLWIGYGFSLFLLVMVLFFPAVNGQKSWIPLPGFALQPSEFSKLFVVMGIADYMARRQEEDVAFRLKDYGMIGGILLVPMSLILMEPDLGQTLVILGMFSAMLIMFLDRKPLIILGSIATLIVGVYVSAIAIFPQQTIHFAEKLPLKEYQKMRIISLVDPEYNVDFSYQLVQAKIAIGSGQLFGRGLLNGSQTQGAFVPEQQTDYIFSAIGEELGFIGASLLLFLFFLLFYRMLRIAMTAGDAFGSYFIGGAMGMFGFQIFENIGMNLTLMPATGVTLPFVSYGGSSLLTNFAVMGIILSIAIRRRRLRF